MAPTEIVLCFLKSWEQNRNPGALFGILAAIAERPANFKVASYKWWAFEIFESSMWNIYRTKILGHFSESWSKNNDIGTF